MLESNNVTNERTKLKRLWIINMRNVVLTSGQHQTAHSSLLIPMTRVDNVVGGEIETTDFGKLRVRVVKRFVMDESYSRISLPFAIITRRCFDLHYCTLTFFPLRSDASFRALPPFLCRVDDDGGVGAGRSASPAFYIRHFGLGKVYIFFTFLCSIARLLKKN
jgi:hypothetical protein